MTSNPIFAILYKALIVLIAGFFLIGGVFNLFPSEAIQADYSRWGYPDSFHYITGMLEIVAALLVIVPRVRHVGMALASIVMLAACGTVLWNGEPARAIPPVIALIVIALCQGFRKMRTATPDV